MSKTRLMVKLNPLESTMGGFFFNSFSERSYLASHHYENLKVPQRDYLKHVQSNLDTNISLEKLEKLYTVTKEKDTDMLFISVSSHNPEFAETLANQFARSYEEYDLQFRQASFLEKELWIKGQLKLQKGKLEGLEAQIKTFMENHPAFSNRQNAEEIVTVEARLQNLMLTMEENEHRYKLLLLTLNQVDSVLVTGVTRDQPLRKELLSLEIVLAKLRVEHGEKNRKVQKILQQMQNIRSLLDEDIERKSYTTTLQSNPRYQELKAKAEDLNTNISVLRVQKRELERMLESAYRNTAKEPELQLTYSRMQRSKSASEKIFSMLNQKLEETRMKKSGVNKEVYQIGNATKAKRIQQGTVNTLSSLLIGLALGILVCFVLEHFDRTLKFPAEIEKKIGIPVLGIIPGLDIPSGKLNLDADSKIIEPYRNLRTNINYSFIIKKDTCKTLIVTSALQGEGKTTKAVNLAICFAFDGKKVLLVDGDLRRPSLHGLLELEKGPGLSEFLTDQVSAEDIIQQTQYNGLYLAAAGSKLPNPAELLGSTKLNSFINYAQGDFDIIFFDSPAIFPVSDALVLAPKMDGTLVVFRSQYTPLKAGQEVLRKLNQVGATVIGGILNDIRTKKEGYYYSYYGYYGYSYYHNYYDEGSSNLRHRWINDIKASTSIQFSNLKAKIKKSSQNIGKAGWLSKMLNWLLLMLISLFFLLWVGIFILKISLPIDYFPKDKLPKEYLHTVQLPKRTKTANLSNHSVNQDSLQILSQLSKWANGFGKLNLPLYISTYSVGQYKYKGGGYLEWKTAKAQEFEQVKDINLKISDIKISVDSNKGRSQFNQILTINGKEDHCHKVQFWIKENNTWLIYKEGIRKINLELGAHDR